MHRGVHPKGAAGGTREDHCHATSLCDGPLRSPPSCPSQVFTFFEVVQGPGGRKDPQFGRTLPERYFEALAYFRTGIKRL